MIKHTHTPPEHSARAASRRAEWAIPAALIALTMVPLVAGVARLVSLAAGAAVTPDNARFFAAPAPVVIHIVGSLLFCLVGAFQFAPAFRRRSPAWHRNAGIVLAAAGIAAALSGLWMAQFYPLAPHLQGPLLYGFRLAVGVGMVASIALGWLAMRRRNLAAHRAWMMRGNAIGQGAGTQVIVTLLWVLAFGAPGDLSRDLLMGAAWLINLAVAELIIRRRPRRSRAQRPQAAGLSPSAGSAPRP